MLVPFAQQSNAEEYSGERLLNYFLRVEPSGSISPGVLIARAGLFANVNTGGRVRNMIEMAGDIYAVSGGFVFKYDISAGTIASLGSVTDNAQVSMAENGQEVAIVTANTYYICDGSTVTSYSTGAMTNPQWVVYVDGYFVLSGTVAGRDDGITISALDDGTTFDALEFAFAENAPDAIRGLAVLNTRVWAFGAQTVEKFWNSGNASFPFEVSKSETLDKGILNGRCWAKLDNSLCWIGDDKIVYRSGGGTPQVISTPSIKEALDASTIEDCYAFFDRGHEFFAIRRTEATTLCYDVTTGLWNERSTGLGEREWIPTCVEKVAGVQYYGTDTGKICVGVRALWQDDGTVINGEAISVPVMRNASEFSIDEINMRAVTPNQTVGAGTVEDYLETEDEEPILTEGGEPIEVLLGIEAPPQIMLQMSDNGVEWGLEQWEYLGDIGEYNRELLWTAQGMFTRAQMRVRVTDAVARDLYGVAYQVS